MTAFTYDLSDGNVSKEVPFSVRFNACSREPGTWKEELFAAARKVTNSTNKPLWVCSSGGIDSEIACRAFYDQGIHFSVLTLEHAGGTNSHDIEFAKKWCLSRGVRHDVVQIDILRFLSEEIDVYSTEYSAIHPFRYLQLKLLETVESRGGYAVLCGDDHLYRARTPGPLISRDDLYVSFSNDQMLPFEWCKRRGTDHEPYFHFSTPELCLAYMRSPIVAFALANPSAVFAHRSNTHVLKGMAYYAAWPDLEPRYVHDGFENVRRQFQDAQKTLKDRFEQRYVQFRLHAPEFYAQLTGQVG